MCTEPTSTGKHWCWQVVALPPEIDGRVHNYGVFAADLDGDGKDSLLLTHHSPSDGSCSTCLSVLDWTGNGFVRVGTARDTVGADADDVNSYAVDYDGDGDLDIVFPRRSGNVSVHVNDGGTLLSYIRFKFSFPSEDFQYFGKPLPMTPGGDGAMNLLVTHNGVATLQERRGDTWHPIDGQTFVLPNCGDQNSVVAGDFDEDGVADYAVMEIGAWCDYIPQPWDPGHPVISIYLTDPAKGTVRAPTWVPVTGDLLYADYPKRIWVVDLDRDGHLDLSFKASDGSYPGPASGIGYSRGRGDGTFEPYEVIWPEPSEAWSSPSHATDLDGDGSIEVVTGLYVISDVLGSRETSTVPIGSTIAHAAADFNGDGLIDLVRYDGEYKLPSRRIVLMSVPVEIGIAGGG